MSGPRTLVVHTGGIGDLLLTCPALIRLADEGPLELLGEPDRLALPVAAGIAEAAHDIDAAGFESVFTEPNAQLRSLLARFDRCIVWMRDAAPIAGGMAACGVADVRTYPGLPPEDWRQHASRYYLTCLGYDDAPALELGLPPAPTTRDVVIHPGSGAHRKNWPIERFRAVAGALTRAGRSVTWCLGPAEAGMELPADAVVLPGGSLVALARTLAASHTYLGNDSGITHLAAAAGCRTVAVFGPTAPAVWAPRGRRVTVVHDQPWPEVAEVLARIPP